MRLRARVAPRVSHAVSRAVQACGPFGLDSPLGVPRTAPRWGRPDRAGSPTTSPVQPSAALASIGLREADALAA